MLLLQLVINGLLIGALYTCLALGFSIIWGVMNLINLSHGTMIMLGAYVSYLAFSQLGIDPFLSIPIAAAILFVIGYALQKYVINLVLGGSPFLTLVLTFGIDILLINALLVFLPPTLGR